MTGIHMPCRVPRLKSFESNRAGLFTQTPGGQLWNFFTWRAQTSRMRLMITIFALVVLLLVDQWKFYGHYTRETARVTRNVIYQVGL